MKTNTALAMLAAGVALALLAPSAPSNRLRAPAGVLAALVLLIGALTGTEHLFQWNLGIDELLARESPGAPATVSPNRMGPPAAATYVIHGLALLFSVLKIRRLAPPLGLAALSILLTPAIGYLLDIGPFFQTAAVTAIAWPTVIALSLLSVGLVALDPTGFPTAQFFRRDEGGRLFRRALPILFMPPGVALVITAAVRAGYFSPVIGIGLFVIAMMLSLALTLYEGSTHVSRAEGGQRSAAEALRESDLRFRELVDDAGAMLWEIDAEGRLTFLSRAWLEFIGASSDTLVGRDWLEALGTIDDATARDKFDAARREKHGFRVEHRVQRSDGETAVVLSSLSPGFARDGTVTGFAAAVADISAVRARDEARTLLASIVESSGDAIITKSLNSVITSWNAAAEKMLGYKAEEAIGRSILMLIPPERQSEEQFILDRIRAGMRIEHFETQRLTKCGDLLDVLLTISPLRDANGTIVGAAKILHDVTQHKAGRRRELQLMAEHVAANAKFRAIFDQSPVFAARLTAEGTVQDANRLSLETSGYRAEDVLGRDFAETPWWRGSETVRGAIRGAILRAAAGDAFRARLPYWWADGSERVIDIGLHPIKDDDGKLLFLHVAGSDITEQETAEAALGESEARFRALADNMSQFAWMADAGGWIFWYNQRWYDYTGTTLEEMRGWGWKKLLHPEHVDRVVARIQRSWDTGEFWSDEFPLRGKDGNYRWFLSTAIPIRDEHGRIVRWIGTNTDITERRAMEADLARAKREAEAANRAKDLFFATLSHELRSPLMPVQLALKAIERDDGLSDQVRSDLSLIRRNVDVEVRLIGDLLDMVRANFGKLQLIPTSVDLNEIVRQVAAECRSATPEKAIALKTTLDANVGEIVADTVRLRQIVGNVLRNAFKFTPAGGTIELVTELRGGIARIVVSDTGPGFSAEDAIRIFGAFEQSHAGQFGGLGLGLAITRSLVELHGGSIPRRKSGPGLGATFTIELPLHYLKPVQIDNAADAGRVPSLGLLLVEDHVDTA